jgi:hypothetical protein
MTKKKRKNQTKTKEINEKRNKERRNKFRVVWDVAPCSHVEVDRRFAGVYCLHHQGDEF